MDTSALKEISTSERAVGNISHIPVQRLAGSIKHQLTESDERTNSGPTKQINRPGAKSVNGTRFTIERVHESETEGFPVHLSKQSKCSPSSQQSEFTVTEPYEKTDMQYTSNVISNVVCLSTDVLSSAVASVHPVNEFKEGTSDVLSDRIVKDVDEVGVGQEEGELKKNTNKVVNDKSTAKEGQDEEVETDVKQKENTEEAFRREFQEQFEAGQEKYQASQHRHQEFLVKEIQKLEEENENALQKHREILAQRLKESIIQLENEQVHIYICI